jgi:hypothetical protein
MAQKMEEAVKTMPKLADSQSWANSKYYKGGFDPKMNKREAALILGKFKLILLSYFGQNHVCFYQYSSFTVQYYLQKLELIFCICCSRFL